MAEESKNLTEGKSEGEKTQITEVKLDMSGMQTIIESNKVLAEQVKILTEEIKKLKEVPPVPIIKEEIKEDKTKGIVKEEKKEEEIKDESLIVEKADVGKGFQIYRDYNKDTSGKFKRLIRG